MKYLLTFFFIPLVLTAAFIAGQFSRQPEINALQSQSLDDKETIQELLAYSYACDAGRYVLEPLYVTEHEGHLDATSMAGVRLSEFETRAQLEAYAKDKGFQLIDGNPPMTITEDDPRWDCRTMGNKICGPVPTPTLIPCDTDSDCEEKNGGSY
jgi:hypothetical protein